MNENIALLGLVEILSALTCGSVILFLTYKIAMMYGRRKLGLDHSNTSFNIIIAGLLFSVGYIVSGSIQPILDSFRIISATDVSKWELVWKFLAYGGMYILIASFCAFVVTLLSAVIYSNMTSVSETKEIKENNIGVAVVLTSIIVTLSIMSSDGIALLIESFIPYPDLPARIR